MAAREERADRMAVVEVEAARAEAQRTALAQAAPGPLVLSSC
jgi:hypothetical protein